MTATSVASNAADQIVPRASNNQPSVSLSMDPDGNGLKPHNIMRPCAGEMEAMSEWEYDVSNKAFLKSTKVTLQPGDTVYVATTDPSHEWAYATTSGQADSQSSGWIPRNILQHKLYKAQMSYQPYDRPEGSD